MSAIRPKQSTHIPGTESKNLALILAKPEIHAIKSKSPDKICPTGKRETNYRLSSVMINS
jgi:hypothetical protein